MDEFINKKTKKMIKKLVLSVVLVGGSLIYASAQDRTVTGTVTGNDGSRLPGVPSVHLPGWFRGFYGAV